MTSINVFENLYKFGCVLLLRLAGISFSFAPDPVSENFSKHQRKNERLQQVTIVHFTEEYRTFQKVIGF